MSVMDAGKRGLGRRLDVEVWVGGWREGRGWRLCVSLSWFLRGLGLAKD